MYKRSVLPLEIASLYNSMRSRERVVPPLAVTHFVQNHCQLQGKYWDTPLFVTLQMY